MIKKPFCVVIPAFNEEKVIGSSLSSLKKIFTPEDIYVVSDGSTDKTAWIAKQEKVNVLDFIENQGKATALKKLIKFNNLTIRYRYILFSDADSRLSDNFLKEMKKYIHSSPALMVGTVTSEKKGFVSAFRTYEYGLSHRVYKKAQNEIKSITVAPGCASLYRSDALEKIEMSHGTLTEDFYLTIQIHQKKLGSIIYVPKAIVVTQDPISLVDYWKQVLRWNTGTWQNVFLHKLYKPNSRLNLELYFLLLDNFLLILSLALALNSAIFFTWVIILMFTTIISLALLISVIEKKYWIIPFIPLFPIFYLINIVAYYYSIPRAIISNKKRLSWNKVERYSS